MVSKKFLIGLVVVGSTMSGCFFESGSVSPEKTNAVENRSTSIPENYDGEFSGTMEEANKALSASLRQMQGMPSNIESDGPMGAQEAMDITSAQKAYANFDAVLLNEPKSPQALLGRGISRFITSFKTKEVNDLVNRISGTSVTKTALAGFGNTDSRVALTRKIASTSRIASSDDLPTVAEVQDVIDGAIVFGLEEAIKDLEKAYNEGSDFKLDLTIDNENRSMGHSEVGIILAGFKTLHASLVFWLAWDLNVDHNGSYTYLNDIEDAMKEEEIEINESYSYEDFNGDLVEESYSYYGYQKSAIDSTVSGDENILTPKQIAAFNFMSSKLTIGSSFLTVRSGWAGRLALVDDEIHDAALIAKEAINSRSSDEKFLINTSNFSNIDAQEASDVLDSVVKYSKTPLTVEIPDSDLTVDIAFYKITEVNDWKTHAPYYDFYDASEWSKDKPVFYFSNSAGVKTANLSDIVNKLEAWNEAPSRSEFVSYFDSVIDFQDPTMSGILPNMTEEKFWNIVGTVYENDQNESNDEF
jgi:hypothetical protein